MLFGPESSGKTTMSKKLSEYYKAAFVPEFARDYLQQKWENKKQICTPEDILPIAQGQIELENNAVNTGNKMIFCTRFKLGLLSNSWAEKKFIILQNPLT